MTTLLITEVFPPRVGGSGRWFWEIYHRLPREQYVSAAGDWPGCEAFDAGHDVRVVRAPLNLRTWGVLRGAWGYGRALACVRRLVRRVNRDSGDACLRACRGGRFVDSAVLSSRTAVRGLVRWSCENAS